MRLLLIQDDESAGEDLARPLISAGFIVDAAETGEEGARLCRTLEYDAVILDLRRPGGGDEILRRLRRAEVQAPALVVTGQDCALPPVDAFGLRSDDSIARPFQTGELVARIRAMVRRARSFFHQPAIYTGRLKLDVAARTAKADGRHIALTAQEYAVLELLSLHRGRLVSRTRLLGHFYDGVTSPDARATMRHVRGLQRKLAAVCHGESYIQTFRCGGLVFQDPGATP